MPAKKTDLSAKGAAKKLMSRGQRIDDIVTASVKGKSSSSSQPKGGKGKK